MPLRIVRYGKSVPPVVRIIAFMIAAYAVAALVIGWGFRFEPLVRNPLADAAMVPATAFCFFLSALALLGAAEKNANMVRTLTAAIVAIIALTFFGQGTGRTEFTGLLFAQVSEADRMAPVTAIGFLLAVYIAYSLLRGYYFAVLAASAFALSGAIGVAFLAASGAPLLDQWFLSGVSLQTSALFGLLFFGKSLTCLPPANDPDQMAF